MLERFASRQSYIIKPLQENLEALRTDIVTHISRATFSGVDIYYRNIKLLEEVEHYLEMFLDCKWGAIYSTENK